MRNPACARRSASVCVAMVATLIMMSMQSVAVAEGASARFGPEKEQELSAREKRFVALVAMRSTAIENAFGPLFDQSTDQIGVKFVRSGEPDFIKEEPLRYDPERRLLIARRALLSLVTDNLRRWSTSYWPYYRFPEAREAMPIIGAIDDALWTAHLQEAAHLRGQSWPHAACLARELAERLGCEMLVAGVQENLRVKQTPLFNANRIDRLWPENLQEFDRRAWRRDDQEYQDVRRLGGIMLVQPLIQQFGAPRALSYVAQTPFRIEDNNVRLSALRYQEQARAALDL